MPAAQAQPPQFRQPAGQPPAVHFPLMVLPPPPVPEKLFCEPPVQWLLPPQPPAELQVQAPQPVQPVGQAPSLQPPFVVPVPPPPGLLATTQLAEPPQWPAEVQAQAPHLLQPVGQAASEHLPNESTLAEVRHWPPPQLVPESAQPQPAPHDVPLAGLQPQDMQDPASWQEKTALEAVDVTAVGSYASSVARAIASLVVR